MESSSTPRVGNNESAKELAGSARQPARDAVRRRPSAELVLQFSAILDKIADQLLEVQAEATQAAPPAARPSETKRPSEETQGQKNTAPEPAKKATVPAEKADGDTTAADQTEEQDREQKVSKESGEGELSEASETPAADSEPVEPVEPVESEANAPLLAQARAAVTETEVKPVPVPVENETTPDAVAGRVLDGKAEEAHPDGAKNEARTETPQSVEPRNAPKLEAAVEKAVKSAKAEEHAAKPQDAASARSEEVRIFEEAVQRKLEGSNEPQVVKTQSLEQQRSVVKESVEGRSIFSPIDKLFDERSASIAEKLNHAARLVGSQERENGLPSGIRQALEAAGPKASGIVKAGPSALQGQGAELQSVLKQAGNSQKEQAESSKALPRALQLRTLEKVESALSEIARSKDGKSISVRLDPPSLGSVKVDISLRDGSLHARIVAESPQVNMLLREKAHELQNLLRRVGLDMERVSVSVGSHDHGAMGGQSGSSSFDYQSQGRFNDVFKGSDFVDAATARVNDRVEIADDHWVA